MLTRVNAAAVGRARHRSRRLPRLTGICQRVGRIANPSYDHVIIALLGELDAF